MGRPPLQVQEGNLAAVLDAAVQAAARGSRATLAVVVDTEGSTYSRAGAAVLFSDDGQAGWLSGGCLEPEIEQRALQAADNGCIDWMEIDTRDDAALFSGSAVGCRGCQRIVLLPLAMLGGVAALFLGWLRGDGALRLSVDGGGTVQLQGSSEALRWSLPAATARAEAWHGPGEGWTLQWRRRPQVLLIGAGPEAAPLWAGLHGLGWRVHVHEQRPAWRARCSLAGAIDDVPLAQRLHALPQLEAALVMQHNFELDRDALELLGGTAIPFIGLLGPARRREDLFTLLPDASRSALQPRLRSPIGLDLGGRGPEAIALCIAAQLQAWRNGKLLDR